MRVAPITALSTNLYRQRLHTEEEKMTPYTRDELDKDWEFKIVRASGYTFSKSEILQKLLEEEARAGWIMLEKFDDSRVRFKRPRTARDQDANLPAGIDPYRTYYDTSPEKPESYAFLIIATILGGLLCLGLLAIAIFIFINPTSR